MVLICSTAIFAESFFEPVEPTGLPYHVIVTNITVNGKPVPAGAEIGVFDGDLCVGNATVTTTGQTNLDIVAWQGNPSYGLIGFVVGHSITFKIWAELYGEYQEISATPTFNVGDGTFGYGSYTSASLVANSTANPQVTVQPSALDFGTITVGQTNNQVLTIMNNGTARLSISSVTTSDYCFNIGSYSSTLNPGQSTNVTVTFAPNAAMPYQATMTIASDDPVNPNLQVDLNGQGILAPQATIQVIPNSLDFGSVEIGKTSTQTLQIQNIGNQTLTVTSVSSNNNRFVPGATSFTITAGQSYTLEVNFTPASEGTVNGYLQIHSNAVNNTNYQVNLTGYGYASYFNPVTPTGLPYIIVIDSATVDNRNFLNGDQIAVFDGTLCVGSTIFRSYPIQLTTWRGDPGNGLAGFTPGNPIAFKVFVNSWEQWTELVPYVTWKQGNGTFGDGEYAVARLKAYSGLEPVIGVNVSALEFPSVQVGGQTTLSFNVTNTGKSNLTINSITSSNNAFGASPANFTLTPSSTRQVTVTFQPSEAKPYSASLTISSNDPNTSAFIITLTGQGLPATMRSIQVSTSPIVFTATKIGATTNASVNIFNTGSASVSITSVQFSNSCFSTTISSIEIAAGASYNLPINFTPNVVGLINGLVTINNNSQNNPTPMINLSGTGYEGYFQPVEPTGIPYTIIIDSLILTAPFDSQIGDEIGIFDGDLCVGNIIIGSTLNDNFGTAWQANTSANLPGFNPGDPIALRYYFLRDGGVNLYSLAYDVVEGDGKFGTMPFASLIARIDREILPPNAPGLINAIGRNSKNILNWAGNSEVDLYKYNIYRSTVSPADNLIDSVLVEPNRSVNFIDDNVQNGSTYYYRISAVDTANNESAFSKEFSATPYGGPVWYIATTGNDSLNNGSESEPFASIQHGINASVNRDTVIVYIGTYVENLRFFGKNIVVRSNEGALKTIIDGNQQNSVVIFFDGEDSTCVLDGFTIRNGIGAFMTQTTFRDGGGIYCHSNPILRNLIIENNSAYGAGGIQIYYANPVLVNCTIRNNTVVGDGGGIYLTSSNAKIENVLIYSNIAGHMGAGIVCNLSNPSLKNVTIYRNSTSPHVIGAGLVIFQNSNPVLTNSIVLNNTPQNIYFFPEGEYSSINITYSDIQDIELSNNGTVTGNIGNINQDPLFINPENDFHLSASSPCIDAGNPASDYSLEPAYNGRRINLGAYGGTPEATPSNPELSISDIIDFPETGVDSTCFATLAITNEGSTRLNLDSLFEEADTTFIMKDTLDKPYLIPGETAELSLRFTPLLVGQYSENLTLKTNDEDEGLKQIVLRGNAVNFPPRIPTGLTVMDSIQAIKLTWNQNTEGDFSHYNLYRGLSVDFSTDASNLIATILPLQTVFIDSLIQNAVTYFYKLAAVDTLNAESDPIICSVLAVYLDIWDVSFNQRRDGSTLVDVNFSFSGHDTTHYSVRPFLSTDDGKNWFELSQTTGEVGLVQPGVNRHFIWNFGQEMPDSYYKNVKLKVRVTTR